MATVLLLVAGGAAGITGGLRLGLWQGTDPGPGLFPFIAGALLLAFTLPRVLRGHRVQGVFTGQDFNRRRLGFYFASLALTALLFGRLGFPLTAWLTLFAVLAGAERIAPWRALPISACMVTGALVLFDYALKVPLPWGLLMSIKPRAL